MKWSIVVWMQMENYFFPIFSRQQICHSLKKIFKWNREENREFIEDASAFEKIGNKDGIMGFLQQFD